MTTAFHTTAFHLHEVSVRFGTTVALDGVGLSVEPGEQVAVIGPSGAGKSTLIRLLNGTLSPTTGLVSIADADLAGLPRRELRAVQRRIGTVHQRFDLVEQLRVVHNVNAGRLGRWPWWKAALSLIRPHDVRTARDALERVGLRGKLSERTADLSGGEQQRVAIARVLVQQPDLILADEPVASLDPARGREVMNLLLELSTDTQTTLLTSLHDVDLALDTFERVIGLRAGRIVFDKRREDLLAHEITALYEIETAPP